MDEVTEEEQAAMAVILDDKVRELVRKHLQEALEDWDFLNPTNLFPLAERITSHVFDIADTDFKFRQAVKRAITDQMMKP
jgi:hypothetical protein